MTSAVAEPSQNFGSANGVARLAPHVFRSNVIAV